MVEPITRPMKLIEMIFIHLHEINFFRCVCLLASQYRRARTIQGEAKAGAEAACFDHNGWA